MNYIVNEVSTSQGIILTITDSDLIGKKFEEGIKQLDLSSNFYKGFERDEVYIRKRAECAYIIHFNGEKSISLGEKWNLIDQKKILKINKIPHAEVLFQDID